MERLEPIDIFKKDFSHALRGYNKTEVNEFLDLIIKNFEEILQENEQLRQALEQHEKEGRRGAAEVELPAQFSHAPAAPQNTAATHVVRPGRRPVVDKPGVDESTYQLLKRIEKLEKSFERYKQRSNQG